MAIFVSKKVDFKKMSREMVRRSERGLTRSLPLRALDIKLRTQKGIDVDGASFEPYTPAYAKYRRVKGRSASPVNLLFTGDLLSSITTKVERSGDSIIGYIYFGDATNAKKAKGLMKKRKFFGLSEENKEKIRLDIKKEMKGN